MPPEVSVIMPVYNCAGTVARAIASAQRQTLRDLEIVVVDDCSTDGTWGVVQAMAAADPRIRPVRLAQNVGAGGARNAALDHATGAWIAVLDADDWYEEARLESLLGAARAAGADVVLDNLQIFDHSRGGVVDVTRHHGRGDVPVPLTAARFFDHDSPLRIHAMGYAKPMVRRDFLLTHGVRYDPSHRTGQDFVFLAEILLSGARGLIVPQAMYIYIHRISPTTRKISPMSRSGVNFGWIVRGCEELLAKYAATISPEDRRALEGRRRIFFARIKCGDMIAALRQGAVVKAAGILAGNPFILALLAATAAKMAYANMRLWRRNPSF